MIRGSLLALLGLAAFVAVYLAMAPDETPPVADVETQPPAEATTVAAVETAPPESDEPAVASAKDASRLIGVSPKIRGKVEDTPEPSDDTPLTAEVRNVTPPTMTAGPKVTGPLTRVEPPKEEPKPRVERLYKPIVVAAGVIKLRGRDIRLAGIAAPDFDARCGDEAAKWPCGRMARAALRRFIRGRAIECDVPPGADDVPDEATCRVAGDDIAEWLVARGWAKRDGSLYGEEEDAARKSGLGLWGKTRPGSQAEVASSG